MNEQRKPDKASSRLGSNAMLVHGVALFAAGATWATVSFVDLDIVSREVILNTGGAAGGVLFVWSAVLSVRACMAVENWRWPFVNLLAVTLEFLALSMWAFAAMTFFDFRNRFLRVTGLPVIAPVLLTGSLIAISITIWRVRKAEGCAIRNGGSEWTRGHCFGHGRWWFGSILTVWTVFVLPFPLFIFCIAERMRGGADCPKWHRAVVERVPETGHDWAESIFSTSLHTEIVRQRLLAYGLVSKERLRERITSPRAPSDVWRALTMLSLKNPPEFLKCSLEIAAGKYEPCENHSTAWHAGAVVGRNATPGEIDALLDAPPRTHQSFYLGLAASLSEWDSQRTARLAESWIKRPVTDPFVRERFVDLLVANMDREQAARCMPRMMKTCGPLYRAYVASCISKISDAKTRADAVLICLQCREETVTVNVLAKMNHLRAEFAADPNAHFCMVDYVSQLLDSSSIVERRAAAKLLANEFNRPAPVPDSETELKDLERIKSLAEEWLKANQR